MRLRRRHVAARQQTSEPGRSVLGKYVIGFWLNLVNGGDNLWKRAVIYSTGVHTLVLRPKVCFPKSSQGAAPQLQVVRPGGEGYRMATGPTRNTRGYRPGQLVPISGIYTVVHIGHRADHEVIAIRGEEFPPCRLCGSEVVFHPAQPTAHMTHDFDLAGPSVLVPKSRAAKRGGI